MIDYHKLKVAQSLLKDFEVIEITIDNQGLIYYALRVLLDDIPYFESENIDELIAKLSELSQINKPKYDVGQKIWTIARLQEPKEFTIAKVHLQSKPFLYKLESDYYEGFCEVEDLIYLTRESLIEAQLEYWTNLKIDAISHSTMCKKCGNTLAPARSVCDNCIDRAVRNHDEQYQESLWAEKEKEYYKKIRAHAECQHESNGISYAIQLPETKGYMCNKCKLCGEFYK